MRESQSTIELRRANALFDTPDRLDLVSWTAPNGVVYVDRPEVIRDIVETGSWK